MVLYKLIRKTQIGSSFMGTMRVDDDVIFFTNKADAKALQNTFNGDKIREVKVDKNCKFIFNIRLIHNFASFGQSFDSLSKAKKHCQEADQSHYHREIYKYKVYSSLKEYRSTKYESKRVFA